MRRFARLAPMVILVALFVASCGDSSTPSPGGSTPGDSQQMASDAMVAQLLFIDDAVRVEVDGKYLPMQNGIAKVNGEIKLLDTPTSSGKFCRRDQTTKPWLLDQSSTRPGFFTINLCEMMVNEGDMRKLIIFNVSDSACTPIDVRQVVTWQPNPNCFNNAGGFRIKVTNTAGVCTLACP